MAGRRKDLMDVRALLRHVRTTPSDRAIARTLGMHRKTVLRYRTWARQHTLLDDAPLPPLEERQGLLQRTLTSPPPPQTVSSVEPYRDLVVALRHAACRQGYDVRFVNAHKMLQHSNGGRADGSWERRLAIYVRPDLLILDDFGRKPLTPGMAEDLYDVIAERYEQGSMLLTSNRAPSEWPELFGSPLLASAGLDRLAHRAATVIMTGQS